MVITWCCVMKNIIRVVKQPSCFGSMYERGEEYMAEKCLGCGAFNDCKKISAGVETVKASVMIPAEPARDHEYAVRW